MEEDKTIASALKSAMAELPPWSEEGPGVSYADIAARAEKMLKKSLFHPGEEPYLTPEQFHANVAAIIKAGQTGVLEPEDFNDDVFNAVVRLKAATQAQLGTLTPEWGQALYNVARAEECDVARRVLTDDPGTLGQRDDPVRSVVYEHLAFLRERGLPLRAWITLETFAKLKALYARHFCETGHLCSGFAAVFGDAPFDEKQWWTKDVVQIQVNDTIAINGVTARGVVKTLYIGHNDSGTDFVARIHLGEP
jgi:hypothetical protein